ncbi:MAG: aryl-sulfate sulfohydrolase, partial [Verrucomicrobia bacterium]|nr:aryl-sulfate sulfohydrolase [Verrucomicrobiota bacterium]
MLRCFLALFLTSLAAHAADKPNIILIYSDDHGWADLGIQGSDQDIRTPHLDALARDGVRFTRGYVSAPQCVPSRAGVLTGRYQQRFGVEDNNKGPLPLTELTIAERLKAAGYVTGQAGKWHLDLVGGKKGDKALRVSKEHMPHAQGFDEYFRGELRQFYASHDLAGKPFADAPHVVADNRFRVVVQTAAALSFLDRRAAQPAQPFFLYLAYYAPHVPLESPEPWFSKTPAHLPKERRQALAMMAAMDEGIGQLRAKLKATGQDQNTLIIFIGDNGAPLGKAWDGSLNTPLIGQKGMLAEGGIRTPFVATWPARLPAGKVYDQPVSSLDVAATAVAAAGLPQAPELDGKDLTPFVTGQKPGSPHERLFWRWGSQAAVLEHPWKLVRLGDREEMLFDVTTPDGESLAKNQAKARPEIVARLRTALKAWSDTLMPPGLPMSLDPHHEGMFAEHGVIADSSAVAPRKNEPAGAIQGWFVRNGSIATKDGALLVTADPKAGKNARPFLAKTGLTLKGPVTAVIKADAKVATNGSLSWRTQEQPDFLPANLVRFGIPAGASEQSITLPVEGQAIHVRLNLGDQAEGLRLRSIELRPAKGGADIAD